MSAPVPSLARKFTRLMLPLMVIFPANCVNTNPDEGEATKERKLRVAPVLLAKTSRPVLKLAPVNVLSIVIVPPLGADTVNPLDVPAKLLNSKKAPDLARKIVPVPVPSF